MCQPYIESTTVLCDIYTNTNPITLPCLFAHVGNKIMVFKYKDPCHWQESETIVELLCLLEVAYILYTKHFKTDTFLYLIITKMFKKILLHFLNSIQKASLFDVLDLSLHDHSRTKKSNRVYIINTDEEAPV